MNGAAAVVWWGTFLLCGAGPSRALAQKPEVSAVQVQMRHVDFHVDSSIVLKIESLRGELQPTSPEHSPYFDDKSSFVLSIDSARIGITPASLGDLLNRYTFAYPGSPLRRLRISVEKGQIRQQGTMKGISFNILADLTLTPTGELRLHPSSVKAAGIGVGGLMKFFGLHLEKLVKLEGVRGVRIDQDDFYLDPPRLLPPPLVKGTGGRSGSHRHRSGPDIPAGRQQQGQAADRSRPQGRELHVLPRGCAAFRQAHHARRRSHDRGCQSTRRVRLLPRSLQRPAGCRV